MGTCDKCDELNIDGNWTGSRSSTRKRDIRALELGSLRFIVIDNLEEADIFEDETYWTHGESTSRKLEKCKSGTASMLPKKVTACDNVKVYPNAPHKYSGFPWHAAYPWDGNQNRRWDAIPKYYGNDSAVCSDWTVDKLDTADTVYNTVIGLTLRADYQSMPFLFFHSRLPYY